ncbi:flagellar hook-associated protein FlgL [Anaerosalibacter sp. Marseille-P3206]|uniref:flagellar hook-associated protein FlgL n=1 Tax=Anaerosalibacter sp. Marseille-P3206 TaxID=1871005 RepID=UPI000985DA30|nr:flagellar hook-associated protein FlgL [Anaerosalibacter sp. Marseille-P3206]
MRITNGMMITNMLFNLNQNMLRFDKLNQQMHTQKKFSVPSDDPIGVSKSLKYHTDLSKIEQYKRNAEDANSWMKETESALVEIGEVLHRANVLAVQMANDTYSKDDLLKVKEEVSQLRESLIEISNSTYAGRHLFSGYKTDKKLLDGDGKYNVDLSKDEIVEYNIGVSETIKVNTVGMKVFGVGEVDDALDTNSTEPFEKDAVDQNNKSYIIAVFEKFEKALAGEVNKEEVDKSLTRIQTCMDQVLTVRSEIGAKMKRLELTMKKLSSQDLSTQELITNNEGINPAEVITKLKTEENIYRASLSMGARIIQPSLADFLR